MDARPAADPRPQAVRVVEVERGSLRETLAYVGTVRPEREVRVLARVAGTLESLPVDEGRRVARGDRLARISAPDLEAREAAAAADLRRARAERDYQCERHATDRRLAEDGVLERERLDLSQKACHSSREAARAAWARLEEVRAITERALEHAPAAGTVLEWIAEPGEHVAPGRPLLLLALDGVEIEAPVVEGDLARGIGPGTAVRIATPSDEQVHGEVARVPPTLEGPARIARVRVRAPHAGGLRPGTSVGLRFVLTEVPDAVILPLDAISRSPDGDAVFVVEDGTVRRVEVVILASEDGRAALEAPLEDGGRVAVSNLDVLRDGMAVFAVPAGRDRR
ncbi:MAG: efflux RND transporter periplasmic adaptor subunit [Myxococcota bacterium]